MKVQVPKDEVKFQVMHRNFSLPKLLANLTSITLEVRGGFASCAALAWRPFCMVNVDSAIMAVGLSCHCSYSGHSSYSGNSS